MHTKHDFPDQKIDPDAIYLTVKDVVGKSGRCRGSVWKDITTQKLPAIWGKVYRTCGTPSRAWLIHPNDAESYIKYHTGAAPIPYANQEEVGLAMNLNYTMTQDNKKGSKFKRDTRRIWPLREGWQTAEVTDSSYLTNYQKFNNLTDALKRGE